MHAIHPHIPRAMLVALAAAVLTILVLLVFFARVGDISLGSSSSGTAAPAATAKLNAPSEIRGPSWLTNPFAPPFQQRIVLPWESSAARR